MAAPQLEIPDWTNPYAPSIEVAVQTAYLELRAAFDADPYPSFDQRHGRLAALESAILRRRDDLIAAADADFCGRSATTTQIGDIAPLLSELRFLKAHLRAWMKPEMRRLALHYRPAKGKVVRQPLGVVGVIAPWNYPFRLALGPLIAAIAAGNRVILKPSENTPRSAELLEAILDETLGPSHCRVLTGGPLVAQALARAPFDHLFFTGSTHVGQALLKTASTELVPVTLELGGKCPVVIHPSADLTRAIRRVVAGKWFNAGQTCMAPDHLWLHKSQIDQGMALLRAELERQYPTLVDNPEYTSVINERHRSRLERLLTDARQHGAQVEVINPGKETFTRGVCKLPPTLVCNPTPDMALAREEIFGPILPIWTYERTEEVIAKLRPSPCPLALYYFDDDARRCRDFLTATRSGGGCLNDVVLHALQDNLPFGGVGASGMGRYHGREGFNTFSNQRAIFEQTRFNWAALLIPPYGRLARRAIDWLAS